jgi:hypothetical protein
LNVEEADIKPAWWVAIEAKDHAFEFKMAFQHDPNVQI